MTIARSFAPGGRWAYFKLYCGETTADRLLPAHLGPLAEQLEADSVITHWFFVRYADTAPHVRVRFHLADTGTWDSVLGRLHTQLADPLGDGLIWKMQADTYDREIDRYGAVTMELTERLFHRDSQAAIRAIRLVHETGDEDVRLQAALLSLQRYADDFSYDIAAWLSLLERLAEGLLGELADPKGAARRLDRKFREKRDAIEALDDACDTNSRLGAIKQALDARSRATEEDRRTLAQLARDGALDVPLDALVGSWTHMTCNRLFTTRQRLHELVVYWFLAKMLRSERARHHARMSNV